MSVYYELAELDLPTSRISARLSTAPEDVLPTVATWEKEFNSAYLVLRNYWGPHSR